MGANAWLRAGAWVWMLAMLAGSEVPQNADEQKAKQLWEKAIAAKAGRESLHRVQNVLISSRAPHRGERPGFEGLYNHWEELYVLPDKFWFWHDDRPSKFGLRAEVFDGTSHWLVYENDPESPRKLGLTTNEKFFLVRAQVFFLMETRWIKPTPVKTRAGRLGLKEVDILQAIVDGYRVIFYLDRNTHLPIKASILSPTADENDEELIDIFSAVFDDYMDVNGVKLPQKVAWGRWLTYSYQINVDYERSLFEGVPRLENGPEAWSRTSKNRP